MENRNMKQHEDWIRTHWRPMMAFVYMAIVLFDFIVGPIFWSIIQIYGGSVTIQWSPLTLIAGGVFHAAMGAVLGISAFTRGQEKVEEIKKNYHEGPDDKGWKNDSLY
jgi:hypothetical protein